MKKCAAIAHHLAPAVLLFLAAPASAQGWADPALRLVPIVLSSSGLNGAFYTSELTLTNRDSWNATLTLTYTAAFGGGGGTGTYPLPAGRQVVASDAIEFLRGRGIPIPAAGNRGGTLLVKFSGLSSPDLASVTVRTLSLVPEGRAGLSYPGFAPATAYQGTVWLGGLRQNAADRSNLALVNAGFPGDGSIALRVTVFSGDGSGSVTLPDVMLGAGGFSQLNEVLAGPGYAQGFASVTRVAGTAPFFAYGVVNDQANADGSFVPPVAATALSATTSMTLPAVVETSKFTTEVVLANWSGQAKSVTLFYAADALTANGQTATVPLVLPARQQVVIPSFVKYLRDRGIAGVPSPGPTFTGPLRISVSEGDLSGIFAGGRTSAAGSRGRYGVFYSAVADGRNQTRDVWIHGLQQTGTDRSNLALVNTGDADGNPDVFQIDLFDGATGTKAATVSNVSVAAHRFFQIGSILSAYAPTVTSAWAHVVQVGGVNSFISYGVVNDGAQPDQRSGDGAFLASSSVGGRVLTNVQMAPLKSDTIAYLQANPADAGAKGITLSGSSAKFATSTGGFTVTAGDQTQIVGRSGFFSLGSYPPGAVSAEARGGGAEQAFRQPFPPAALLVQDGQPPEPIAVGVTIPDADRSGMNPPGAVLGARFLLDAPLPCPRADSNGPLCPTNACPPCEDHPPASPERVCLDYDGLCADGHHYGGADCSLATVNFLGSTCFSWSLDFPCCVNEGAYVAGGPTCWDNHKGRTCKTLVSAGHGFQMTAGSLTTEPIPDSTAEKITLACGQSVRIALHNSACANTSLVSLNGARGGASGGLCPAGGTLTDPSGAPIGASGTAIPHYTGSSPNWVHVPDLTLTYTAPTSVNCSAGTATDVIDGKASGFERRILVAVNCPGPASPPPSIINVREDIDPKQTVTSYSVPAQTFDNSRPTYSWQILYPPGSAPCGGLVDPKAAGSGNGFQHAGCPEDWTQAVKIKVTVTDGLRQSTSCTFCARSWEGRGPIPASQACTSGACP